MVDPNIINNNAIVNNCFIIFCELLVTDIAKSFNFRLFYLIQCIKMSASQIKPLIISGRILNIEKKQIFDGSCLFFGKFQTYQSYCKMPYSFIEMSSD